VSIRARWRIGVGPVFVYECLTSSRRWQGYAMRAGFLLLLLIALLAIWDRGDPLHRPSPIVAMAMLGKVFYYGFVGTQLTLLMLVAPAVTAGSICLDRARGTLAHMLVTDLSSAEIVLGKLAGRLVPVLGLLACTLPLMEILALVGGLDPDALLGAFVVGFGIAVLGSSLALFFSLWVGKTHQAILATYAVWFVWLFWTPISAFVRALFPQAFFLPPPLSAHPFKLAFAPYLAPTLVAWQDYASFLEMTLALSAILVAMTVFWLRATVTRDSLKRRPSRSLLERLVPCFARGRPLPRPSLDWNPVFWREWHCSKPSRWSLAVVALYFALATTFSLTTVAFGGVAAAPWVNGVQVSAGLLILSVIAADSLAEERARGSLDLLLTTMMSTPQIVLGKWLGTYRAVPLIAALPAVVSFSLAYDRREHWTAVVVLIVYIFCAGAAITSLGLAMATWLPRAGGAVAATVSIYLAITVGYLFVVLGTGPPFGTRGGLTMASPFAWAYLVTLKITDRHPVWDFAAPWAIFWLSIMAIAAVALLIATLANFDRKLGRIESDSTRMMNGIFTRSARTFRFVFFVVAALATLDTMSGGPTGESAFVINGTQVLVGLLLAAIAATNSTARQFERNPMAPPPVWLGWPALKNVLANWLGPCRLVALMALLATLVVLARWEISADPFVQIWLVPAYIMFAGAAWCAFGVAVGIRFTRRTALLALAVAYGLVLIAAPISTVPFSDVAEPQVLRAANPFVAVSMLTQHARGHAPPDFNVLHAVLGAAALYAAAIAILLTDALFVLERRGVRNPTSAAPGPAETVSGTENLTDGPPPREIPYPPELPPASCG
jgi:ABC-type transport system involved in multi-copper enzyme maturation permease subunit